MILIHEDIFISSTEVFENILSYIPNDLFEMHNKFTFGINVNNFILYETKLATYNKIYNGGLVCKFKDTSYRIFNRFAAKTPEEIKVKLEKYINKIVKLIIFMEK